MHAPGESSTKLHRIADGSTRALRRISSFRVVKKPSTPATRRAQRLVAGLQVAGSGAAAKLPQAVIPQKFAQLAVGLGMFVCHREDVPQRDRAVYLFQGLLATAQFVFSTIRYVHHISCDADSRSDVCVYEGWLDLIFAGTLALGWGMSEASRDATTDDGVGEASVRDPDPGRDPIRREFSSVNFERTVVLPTPSQRGEPHRRTSTSLELPMPPGSIRARDSNRFFALSPDDLGRNSDTPHSEGRGRKPKPPPKGGGVRSHPPSTSRRLSGSSEEEMREMSLKGDFPIATSVRGEPPADSDMVRIEITETDPPGDAGRLTPK